MKITEDMATGTWGINFITLKGNNKKYIIENNRWCLEVSTTNSGNVRLQNLSAGNFKLKNA